MRALVVLAVLVLAGCTTTSTVPAGSGSGRGTATDLLLAFDASPEAGGDPSCGSRKVTSREVSRPFEPGLQGLAGRWSERWTVDRCGSAIPYVLDFTRDVGGHLDVSMQREEPGDRVVAMPGSTIADPVLQRDTFIFLAQRDLSLSEGACRSRKIVSTEVLEPLAGAEVKDGRPVAGQWVERWTLDQCGAPVRYIVRFVTTRDGTTFTAEREK